MMPMMPPLDVRLIALISVFIAIAALLILHVAISRFWLAKRAEISPQKVTAILGLMLNIPLAMGLLAWGGASGLPWQTVAWALLYVLLVFSSVAYSYFHVFNLSETGRRIRMLVQLLEGGELHAADHGVAYGGHEMVSQRLVRLQQMGQISETRGRYLMRGKFLWMAANLLQFIGKLTTGHRGKNVDSTS